MKYLFFLLLVALTAVGCGRSPRPIGSALDIRFAPTSETMIVIVDLPLKDWSKLQKFESLEHFSVGAAASLHITDEHLIALSHLSMPKLHDVSLSQCQKVTDDGISSLSRISSIRSLQLNGVGITDNGMHMLATTFHNLTGINVEDCKQLTTSGFLSLTNSRTIESVSFSVGDMSQEELTQVLTSVPNVIWWTIRDQEETLDLDSLAKLGSDRYITIQIVDTNGSVQGLSTNTRENRVSP